MLDVEVLCGGEGVVQRGVTDLGDGRKLPIWFSARDCYLKSSEPGCKSNEGEVITELHICIVFPDVGCTADELDESRGVKVNLIEESYAQGAESGGVDDGHEVL
jgi:hypothetical protein